VVLVRGVVVVVVTIVVNATKDGVSYRAAATRGRVFDWEIQRAEGRE
jgi:hypothetical protein